VVAVDSEDRGRDLAPASTNEAGECDDLTRLDVERDVGENTFPREPFDAEHGVADRLLLGLPLEQVTADHRPDESVRGHVGKGAARHPATVAEDRHALAELEHLLEAVRDEEHGGAPGPEALDDTEQPR